MRLVSRLFPVTSFYSTTATAAWGIQAPAAHTGNHSNPPTIYQRLGVAQNMRETFPGPCEAMDGRTERMDVLVASGNASSNSLNGLV